MIVSPSRLRRSGLRRGMVALIMAAALRLPAQPPFLMETWDVERGLPNSTVTGIAQGPDGYLWLSTLFGLARFDGLRFRAFTGPTTPGLHVGGFNRIAVDRTGDLWALTEDGRLANRRGADFVTLSRTDLEGEGVDLETDAAGEVWVTLADGGMARCAERRVVRGPKPLPVKNDPAWLSASNALRTTTEEAFSPSASLRDPQGRSWFATRGQGLVRVDPDGTTTHLTTRNGLPSNSVRALFEDREGDVWAGTDRGLVRLRPRQLQVIALTDKDSEGMATGLAEGPEGSLWAGTFNSGVCRIKQGRDALEAEPPLAGPRGCRGLCFDRDGHLWVGTVEEGLWQMTSQGLAPVFESRRIGGGARSLFADSQGRLWIGTTKGLFSWADGDLQPHIAPTAWGRLDVRTMIESRDGGLWVGTHDQGILRWREGKWWREPGLDSDQLQSLCALHEDHRGQLWIGTQGAGLAWWSGGRLQFFNTTAGLASHTIHSILEDDQRVLWLGTQQGIFRLPISQCEEMAAGQRPQLEPGILTRSDGLPTLQCTGGFQPTACRTRDGRLWFATIKGVVAIDPWQHPPAGPPATVLIEELRVRGRSVPTVSGLRLDPRPSRVEFRFTAPSFAAPEKIRFRYRLAGEEQEWTDAGTERTAVFNALQPGRYVFQVTAANASGVWNETGAALAFTVTPAWWQTWWFQGGVALGVIGLAAGTVRMVFTRRLQRRLEVLEHKRALERERARIAQDIHDELGTSLTRIIMLSQSPDDEGRLPGPELGKIQETTRDLTRAMDEVVWAVNPRQDTLEGLTSYLSLFAQEFLGGAGIRCRLDVPVKMPAWPLTAELRHNLFLAAKEAVHNAARHARAREVRLSLQLREKEFVLEISDDGIGFEPPQPTQPQTRHGLGNMRDRLIALGGRCDIQSAPQEGTVVRLTVPVPSAPAV